MVLITPSIFEYIRYNIHSQKHKPMFWQNQNKYFECILLLFLFSFPLGNPFLVSSFHCHVRLISPENAFILLGKMCMSYIVLWFFYLSNSARNCSCNLNHSRKWTECIVKQYRWCWLEWTIQSNIITGAWFCVSSSAYGYWKRWQQRRFCEKREHLNLNYDIGMQRSFAKQHRLFGIGVKLYNNANVNARQD